MAPAPTLPTADAHKPGKAQRHSDERERLLAHRQGLHRASGAALHCQADLVEQNRNLKADNLELTAALHTTNQAFDASHALNHAAWLDQDDTNRNLKAESGSLSPFKHAIFGGADVP